MNPRLPSASRRRGLVGTLRPHRGHLVEYLAKRLFSAGIAPPLFVAWALPLLICVACIVPPWMNSDEPFHMLRAAQLAHGGIIGRRFGSKLAGGNSDLAIFEAYLPVRTAAWDQQKLTPDALRASNVLRWRTRTQTAWFANTVQYPPTFYIPDVFAYWLGRICHMRVNATLVAARIANAVVFTALAAAAIARSRRTRPLLIALLMLPMSLALAASASQDALMLPVAALIVAAVDTIAESDREASHSEMLLLAAGLVALATARPPYATLVILLLLIRHPIRGRTMYFAASCALIAAWCGVAAATVMVQIGPSDAVAQIHQLSAAPARVFVVARNTLGRSFQYWSEFIGRLAWDDTPLPALYRAAATLVLGLSALAASVGRTSRRGAVIVAVALAVLMIFALQYLDWTPVGSMSVDGVVGRYFIPLAMVMALALPSFPQIADLRRGAAYAGIGVLAAVTPAVMFTHYIGRFFTP